MKITKSFTTVIAATLALLSTSAVATTYTNAPSATISTFGSPDTTTYGQVFTAPGESLTSWSFYTSGSNSGGASFVVAAWDGSKAIGPALFTSASDTVSASGEFFSHTYNGINLSLTAGTSFVAYLTTAGVAHPLSGITFSSSATSPLGGSFKFLNSSGQDPLTSSGSWSSWSQPNTQYSATFSDIGISAAPEPATWGMMIGGFGIAGASLRTRRRKTVMTCA